MVRRTLTAQEKADRLERIKKVSTIRSKCKHVWINKQCAKCAKDQA